MLCGPRHIEEAGLDGELEVTLGWYHDVDGGRKKIRSLLGPARLDSERALWTSNLGISDAPDTLYRHINKLNYTSHSEQLLFWTIA